MSIDAACSFSVVHWEQKMGNTFFFFFNLNIAFLDHNSNYTFPGSYATILLASQAYLSNTSVIAMLCPACLYLQPLE